MQKLVKFTRAVVAVAAITLLFNPFKVFFDALGIIARRVIG